VSISYMGSDRFRWLAPLLKEGISWAFFIFWIVLGAFATAIFAGSYMTWSSDVDWSRVIAFGLLGLVSLLASILALRNRRQAGRLFLLVAPLAAGCFVLWQRSGYYPGTYSLQDFILTFVGAAALFVAPGLFWLITGRFGWRPLIGRPATVGAPRQPFILNLSIFLLLILACAFGSLYFPISELDCNGHPPVSVQTSPEQAVFTGKILLVGRPRLWESRSFPWALLHAEHIYWGLPRWMGGLVFVRGNFKDEDRGQEYFVDAYRSEGVLTRFLPIVEHYPCCHTTRLSNAEG